MSMLPRIDNPMANKSDMIGRCMSMTPAFHALNIRLVVRLLKHKNPAHPAAITKSIRIFKSAFSPHF
jgi:hypothetical protein